MTAPNFDSVNPGDELPPLTLPALNRTVLALFAGASGDHNAVHIDLDVARAAGQTDVFAHGMLGMAWLGRLLTHWAPQAALKHFDVRFQGITHLSDIIQCKGRVIEKIPGERCVRVALETVNQSGETKIVGEALLALP